MIRKDLKGAIRNARRGRMNLQPEVAAKLSRALDEQLSAREMEVLRQVAAGGANKQIAARQSLSEETVKSHMSILGKLEARDRMRERMVLLLNQQLADGLDLGLQLKHAHWNVKGPLLASLHELCDVLAEELEDFWSRSGLMTPG
jgi:DNA-binding CsgD family transcriptional regulator